MKLLRKKDGEDKGHGLPIELQVGLEMRDPASLGRIARRLLDKEVRKLVQRHGSLAHPETGAVPTVLFYMERAGSPGTIRLKTDDESLREHLAAKGLAVLGETREGDAGHAPSAAAA